MPIKLFWSLVLIIFLQFPSFSQEIPLSFRPVAGTPYFESPEFMIDSAEYNTLIVRLKSKQSGTARLFWATSYDMQFNQPKSLWFSVKAGQYGYYFNIPSQNPNWIGWIRKFIIYPETAPENTEIISAKIIKGNLFTNIASGWQEFWGPNGRVVIGSTINLIPSSAIFGRSINIYIYWLTGIFFLAAFAWQRSFHTAGRWAIYFALAAWIVLALNTDVNYFNIFKSNFGKYFGKTIEEKRAVAYGKEYYDFLVFAKSKLPDKPVKFGLISSRYAPELQARIYLVPHALIDNPEKDFPYLLVFIPGAGQKVDAAKYQPFAKLNSNAYILKRR